MALMQVESDTPEYFATMMDHYRTELIEPQRDTERRLKDAGAVSLGIRLDSSKYPHAYDAVAYGRGTWLIHMLRTMYRDAAAHPSSAVRTSGKTRRSAVRKPVAPAPPPAADPDAAFFGVLRKLQEQFAGKSMATRDLRAAFEQALPQDLRFEGRKSLDWFFDEWVSGTAVPKIELKQVRFNKGPKRAVSFTIAQSECPKTLITSVPIYIEKDSGPPVFLARVFADGEETEFRLDVPVDAKKLLLDPYRTVLRM
jgi:aminopeptidase N